MSQNFGARDLALLLPDEAGDINALRHTVTKNERDEVAALKPKVDMSRRVQRHRKGKLPTMCAADEDDDDDDDNDDDLVPRKAIGGKLLDSKQKATLSSTLEPARTDSKSRPEKEEGSSGGRRRVEAAVLLPDKPMVERQRAVADPDSESDSDDSNDSLRAEVQRRLRERMAARRGHATEPKEEEEEEVNTTEGVKLAAGSGSNSDSGSSSSSDEESSEEEEEEEELLKPIFVPKSQRQTTVDRDTRMVAAEDAENKRVADKERRREESRALVAKSVAVSTSDASSSAVGDPHAEAGCPDDSDAPLSPEAEAEEEAQWRQRELRRLVRDRKKSTEREAEAKEVARRRALTEEERFMEDEAAGRFDRNDRASSRGFMQKYYHKGAFYMDESSVKDKNDVRKTLDAGARTLRDKLDVSAMPKVMQVKNFGMKGQTKYTHLADQDTSSKDALWDSGGGGGGVRRKFETLDDAGRKRKKARKP